MEAGYEQATAGYATAKTQKAGALFEMDEEIESLEGTIKDLYSRLSLILTQGDSPNVRAVSGDSDWQPAIRERSARIRSARNDLQELLQRIDL